MDEIKVGGTYCWGTHAVTVTKVAGGIVHVEKADGTWSCYSLNDFRKHFVGEQ